jgi:hypothetical protein
LKLLETEMMNNILKSNLSYSDEVNIIINTDEEEDDVDKKAKNKKNNRLTSVNHLKPGLRNSRLSIDSDGFSLDKLKLEELKYLKEEYSKKCIKLNNY